MLRQLFPRYCFSAASSVNAPIDDAPSLKPPFILSTGHIFKFKFFLAPLNSISPFQINSFLNSILPRLKDFETAAAVDFEHDEWSEKLNNRQTSSNFR